MSDNAIALQDSGLMLGYEHNAPASFRPGGHIDHRVHGGLTISGWLQLDAPSSGGYLVVKDVASGTSRGTGDGVHRSWALYIEGGANSVKGQASIQLYNTVPADMAQLTAEGQRDPGLV